MRPGPALIRLTGSISENAAVPRTVELDILKPDSRASPARVGHSSMLMVFQTQNVMLQRVLNRRFPFGVSASRMLGSKAIKNRINNGLGINHFVNVGSEFGA